MTQPDDWDHLRDAMRRTLRTRQGGNGIVDVVAEEAYLGPLVRLSTRLGLRVTQHPEQIYNRTVASRGINPLNPRSSR
jgi:hypothetical protein